MITRAAYEAARQLAWEQVQEAGMHVRPEEFEQIEIADLGLSEFDITGAAILTLASSAWLGVKLLILQPNQFFPQHRHPPSVTENYPGKEEVIRGVAGTFYAYLPGEATAAPAVTPPGHRREHLTVWYEVVIRPGDQQTIPPNTWHWFQAGANGAIVWSFSSKVTDAQDKFTDPQVTRQTVITD